MTIKPVCLRFGSTSMNFKTEEEFWMSFTDLAKKVHGHGGVTKIMRELAVEWFAKYEGKAGNMDQFLDENYVPEPNLLNSSFEQKLHYLRTQPVDKLKDFRDELYRLRIMTMAMIDVSPEERKDFDKEYIAMYHNYKNK